MSKSIFAKYILTFILIIVLSFGIMMSIMVALVDNYSKSLQTEIIKGAAKSVESYIELQYVYSNSSGFDEFTLQNSDDILNIMSSVTENCEGISLFIADTNGKLILHSYDNENGIFENGEHIDSRMLYELKQLKNTDSPVHISGIRNSHTTSFSMPIVKEDVMHGAIIATYSDDSLSDVMDKMVDAILVSSVWVMVAALVVVYVITEMITNPLKQMSRAAKQLAKGNFDVRIRVRGRDEVAELAESFNNMADSLQNLETTRNTFIANISHDLRTPMTTISGFIDNILAGAIPPQEEHYYLGIIKEEIRRLSRLVASLLDISRIQEGDRKLTMTSFDICETARLILISFEQQIDEKNLNVDFECDEDRIFVVADRDAIYQVLYNICDNAVKFASNGGKYKIAIKKSEINRKKKIVVSVYNQGDGIPEDDINFVFERFYKVDKSRGIDKKGVGLGMFISKTILDNHGEEIWVESKFGEYCEFFFTLTRDKKSNN